MIDIKSMYIEELEQFIVSMGEKKFHAVQLYKWMHQKLVPSFSECRSEEHTSELQSPS